MESEFIDLYDVALVGISVSVLPSKCWFWGRRRVYATAIPKSNKNFSIISSPDRLLELRVALNRRQARRRTPPTVALLHPPGATIRFKAMFRCLRGSVGFTKFSFDRSHVLVRTPFCWLSYLSMPARRSSGVRRQADFLTSMQLRSTGPAGRETESDCSAVKRCESRNGNASSRCTKHQLIVPIATMAQTNQDGFVLSARGC